MRKCGPDNRGYTLLEMIITLLLVSVVSVITLFYLVNISRLYSQLYAKRQADGIAMDTWNRLLREIRLWQDSVTADDVQLQFVNKRGATNICQYSGNTVTWNGNLLAEDMHRFVFTYYDATNGVLLPTPLDSQTAP